MAVDEGGSSGSSNVLGLNTSASGSCQEARMRRWARLPFQSLCLLQLNFLTQHSTDFASCAPMQVEPLWIRAGRLCTGGPAVK